MRIGDKVLFGRTNGEKTLGEIVKVNPKKLKVRQLESRGTMRDYPVGTIWTVHPSLCTQLPSTATAAASSKRPEREILRDIADTYCGLSPENLCCDGEASSAHIASTYRRLRTKLKGLFTELGREVTESEAYTEIR